MGGPGGPGRAYVHPLGSQAQPIRMSFLLTKKALLQTETLLTFISCPGGWSAGEEAGCGGPGLAWLHVV